MIVFDSRKMGGYAVFFHVAGSALLNVHSFPMALTSAVISVVLSYEPVTLTWLMANITQSTAYFGGLSFIVGFVVVFRLQVAYQRYDSAQASFFSMQSKLVDFSSFISAFLIENDQESRYVRQTLLRWLQAYHEIAIEEFQGVSFGQGERQYLTKEEVALLQRDRKRTIQISSWLLRMITERRHKFKTGDPMLSRAFQVVTDMNTYFNQARRVAETPFPFPFVQLSALMIHVWALITPCIVAAFMPTSLFFAPITSGVGTWILFAVNELAAILENPWETNANNLPTVYYSVAFHDDISSIQYMLLPDAFQQALELGGARVDPSVFAPHTCAPAPQAAASAAPAAPAAPAASVGSVGSSQAPPAELSSQTQAQAQTQTAAPPQQAQAQEQVHAEVQARALAQTQAQLQPQPQERAAFLVETPAPGTRASLRISNPELAMAAAIAESVKLPPRNLIATTKAKETAAQLADSLAAAAAAAEAAQAAEAARVAKAAKLDSSRALAASQAQPPSPPPQPQPLLSPPPLPTQPQAPSTATTAASTPASLVAPGPIPAPSLPGAQTAQAAAVVPAAPGAHTADALDVAVMEATRSEYAPAPLSQAECVAGTEHMHDEQSAKGAEPTDAINAADRKRELLKSFRMRSQLSAVLESPDSLPELDADSDLGRMLRPGSSRDHALGKRTSSSRSTSSTSSTSSREIMGGSASNLTTQSAGPSTASTPDKSSRSVFDLFGLARPAPREPVKTAAPTASGSVEAAQSQKMHGQDSELSSEATASASADASQRFLSDSGPGMRGRSAAEEAAMLDIRAKNASKRLAHIDLNRPIEKQSSSSSFQPPSPPLVSPATWSPPTISPFSGQQELPQRRQPSSFSAANTGTSPAAMKHSMSSNDENVMYHTVSGADGRRMAAELVLEREKQRRAALNRAVMLRLKLEQQRDQMRRSVASVHTVSAGATSDDSHLVELAAFIVDEETRTRLGIRKHIKNKFRSSDGHEPVHNDHISTTTSEEDLANKSLASRMRSTPEECASHGGDHTDAELHAWDRAYSGLSESIMTSRSEVKIVVPPRESSPHIQGDVTDGGSEDGFHPAFGNALAPGAWLSAESLCQARARGKFLIFT